jgi:hypothetical protein
MRPLCDLTYNELIDYKCRLHHLERDFRIEHDDIVTCKTRAMRLSSLLRRVHHRLVAVYNEFEQRDKMKRAVSASQSGK